MVVAVAEPCRWSIGVDTERDGDCGGDDVVLLNAVGTGGSGLDGGAVGGGVDTPADDDWQDVLCARDRAGEKVYDDLIELPDARRAARSSALSKNDLRDPDLCSLKLEEDHSRCGL